MSTPRPFPLDYRAGDYVYVERANQALVELFRSVVLPAAAAPRVLDVGAGAGANARAFQRLCPATEILAIEPNARAARALRQGGANVFEGSLEDWLGSGQGGRFDAVLLSDVIEHVERPVAFLESLLSVAGVREATFLISVPNYAVWYNRASTLFGRFEYGWSGLYDRTHLRFFTRGSLRRMLEHTGLHVFAERQTPSLVQAAAPLLRRLFERDVDRGEHLALEHSALFRMYSRYVEPAETRVCSLWPELLGFQIVCAARRPPPA